MDVKAGILIFALCRLFAKKKARIGKIFIENVLTDTLARKDADVPQQLAILGSGVLTWFRCPRPEQQQG
jgi:hypothetical protein